MVIKSARNSNTPLIGSPRNNPVAANKWFEFSARRPGAALLKLKENKIVQISL